MLQYAQFGTSGNQLSYVYKNNIYYMSHVGARPTQITDTGIEDVVFNGVPDRSQLYEDEILLQSLKFVWSPDGKRLGFRVYDSTNVETLEMVFYGSYEDLENAYPKIDRHYFSKASKKIPKITLHVTNLENFETDFIQPAAEFKNKDYYFGNAQWTDNDTFILALENRVTNVSILSFCEASAKKWECETNLVLSRKTGWVQGVSDVFFTADKKYYFLLAEGPEIENRGSFMHVAMVDRSNGEMNFLTSGTYDVMDINSYNPETRTLYYIATADREAGVRYFYGVTDALAPNPKVVTKIESKAQPGCRYVKVKFSPDGVNYVFLCSGPGIPTTESRSTRNETHVSVIDINDTLRKAFEEEPSPIIKTRSIRVPFGMIYYKLKLPQDFDENEKYPVVLCVYAGPEEQEVSSRYDLTKYKQKYVTVGIDGRGSIGQGNRWRFTMYRRLGTVEIEDQISTMKIILEENPFLDKDRVAVWGWSYGGYATAMILGQDKENIFKCGVSVAPVSSWRYYNAWYSERYMQSPTKDDNLKNYLSSEVMNYASNFKGKKFLLMHGLHDGNVQFQHSAMLVKALLKEKILFKMQVYPDQDHNIYDYSYHVYATRDEFLDECFASK